MLVTCFKQDCSEGFKPNHKAKWEAHKNGWFFEKNGKVWCPTHRPAWVETWRKSKQT